MNRAAISDRILTIRGPIYDGLAYDRVCAILIIDGVVGFVQQNPANRSPTALIPAFFGIPLVICGGLAFVDRWRKHVMHFAVIVGFFGLFGGISHLLRLYNKAGNLDPASPKAISGEVMIAVCLVFVVLCVKSFIDARKARRSEPVKVETL